MTSPKPIFSVPLNLSFDEPFWWYGNRGTAIATALAPAAALYGSISARRMERTPCYAPPIPVICVGNFVAGGSGKSPVVAALVCRLKALGRRPAILTRGYGGTEAGPVWVDAANAAAAKVGDEPLMLARYAPVMVSRKRDLGARAIVADGTCDVIVMDDGLQNPDLEKSLSIAVVNGRRGLGNARVIPAGPLRAPLDRQLPLTNAILITDTAPDERRRAALPPQLQGRPILTGRIMPRPIAGLAVGARVFVFAAIANPERVLDSAAALGLQPVGSRMFRDHHPFTDGELASLVDDARRHDARLVTTEKDLARLRTGSQAARALAEHVTILEIEVALDAADAAALDALLMSAVDRT
jgi:tetraacyldisaccharide 4'-kinase